MAINWTQFYYLVFYFIIYSIGGWATESIYRSICEKKLINSGFMYGPYCPIYGFGTLIMILTLQHFKSDITLLFIISFVVLTAWEYAVGVYLEKVYHARYWDYSSHRINVNGRICLLNSIYWGILGVVFTKIIHPLVMQNSMNIPVDIVFHVDVTIGTIMIIDFIISSIKTQTITKKIEQLKVISDRLKEKLSKLKSDSKKNTEEKELMQLQLQQSKLKMALYRQLTRMKNAFPTMKFEPINKFLSDKIDIKELKDKIKSIKRVTKILKKGPREENIDKTSKNDKN